MKFLLIVLVTINIAHAKRFSYAKMCGDHKNSEKEFCEVVKDESFSFFEAADYIEKDCYMPESVKCGDINALQLVILENQRALEFYIDVYKKKEKDVFNEFLTGNMTYLMWANDLLKTSYKHSQNPTRANHLLNYSLRSMLEAGARATQDFKYFFTTSQYFDVAKQLYDSKVTPLIDSYDYAKTLENYLHDDDIEALVDANNVFETDLYLETIDTNEFNCTNLTKLLTAELGQIPATYRMSDTRTFIKGKWAMTNWNNVVIHAYEYKCELSERMMAVMQETIPRL